MIFNISKQDMQKIFDKVMESHNLIYLSEFFCKQNSEIDEINIITPTLSEAIKRLDDIVVTLLENCTDD